MSKTTRDKRPDRGAQDIFNLATEDLKQEIFSALAQFGEASVWRVGNTLYPLLTRWHSRSIQAAVQQSGLLLTDSDGNTPAHLVAVKRECSSSSKMHLLGILKKVGEPLNRTNDEGKTPAALVEDQFLASHIESLMVMGRRLQHCAPVRPAPRPFAKMTSVF